MKIVSVLFLVNLFILVHMLSSNPKSNSNENTIQLSEILEDLLELQKSLSLADEVSNHDLNEIDF